MVWDLIENDNILILKFYLIKTTNTESFSLLTKKNTLFPFLLYFYVNSNLFFLSFNIILKSITIILFLSFHICDQSSKCFLFPINRFQFSSFFSFPTIYILHKSLLHHFPPSQYSKLFINSTQVMQLEKYEVDLDLQQEF